MRSAGRGEFSPTSARRNRVRQTEPMDQQRTAEHAAAFGQAAKAYERGRPPYPSAAVDWLLPDAARRVLDLGAGTGKLTAQLCSRGLQVTAVEPSDGMLAQLIALLPAIPALAGSAEEIPLLDDSLDCVLVAQAWHWVDADRALPEVARVLRAGGRLGLLWNVRDERVDWVADLGAMLRSVSDEIDTNVSDLGKWFGPLKFFEMNWEHSMTPLGLLDLVASRSYFITAPQRRQESLLAQVRDLLDSHPCLVGRNVFAMPYVTRALRADLLDVRRQDNSA